MLGDDTELSNDIQKHIEKWKTVSERLQTKSNTIGPKAHILLPETNGGFSGFLVDSSRPLVSVIARIMPSPDWFIGVRHVSLCNTSSGQWLKDKRIPLFPYDAGTARRSAHNDSIVVPSSPRQGIIYKPPEADIFVSDSVRGMGYMRFIQIGEHESGSSQVVIDEDNCPNMALLRQMSSLVWFSLIVTMMILI